MNRKLKAQWTMESQQDLRATHGIEAEAELNRVISFEIWETIGITDPYLNTQRRAFSALALNWKVYGF